MRTSYGVVLRGAGGNPQAIERAGWSLLQAKVTMFALAGFFGMLSGLALIGLTTSADANIALRYTLLSIAGVILGGGEFVGGRVSPVGAVIGAMTLTLAGSVPVLPAHPARLADRRAGRDPDHRAGAARAHRPRGRPRMTALRRIARQALALVLARRARWSGSRPSPSPAARAAASVLTAALTFATFFVIVGLGQMFVDHARARQCRPLDPGQHDAGRRRRHEGHGRRRTR